MVDSLPFYLKVDFFFFLNFGDRSIFLVKTVRLAVVFFHYQSPCNCVSLLSLAGEIIKSLHSNPVQTSHVWCPRFSCTPIRILKFILTRIVSSANSVLLFIEHTFGFLFLISNWRGKCDKER